MITNNQHSDGGETGTNANNANTDDNETTGSDMPRKPTDAEILACLRMHPNLVEAQAHLKISVQEIEDTLKQAAPDKAPSTMPMAVDEEKQPSPLRIGHLFLIGWTIRQIGTLFGLTDEEVRRILREFGVDPDQPCPVQKPAVSRPKKPQKGMEMS
jgi:hypothetical protein